MKIKIDLLEDEKPKCVSDVEAIIAISDYGTEFLILGAKFTQDFGMFDNGYHFEDIPLMIPERLHTGLYKCTDFYVPEHSIGRDRESGLADEWHWECTWEKIEVKELSELQDKANDTDD